MKATVFVRLKSEVLDPQGDAIKRALAQLGFDDVKNVRVGKMIEVEFADASNHARVQTELTKMADELLANPVIEDYEVIAPKS
jgi:phosphoribosylformylglycinamidine synthase